MSSSRIVQRRGAAPVVLTPHPKPMISVEEWEAKAPLGELEIRSINVMKLAGERTPLPLKVA